MDAIGPIVSLLIILGGPLLPSHGFVENTFVRLLLILWIVYSSRQGVLHGLLAFLAAFTLLIERNHEVLIKLPNQRPRPFENYTHGLKGAANMYPIEAAPLVGKKDEIPFAPQVVPSLPVQQDVPPQVERVIDDNTAVGRRDNNPRLPAAPPMKDAVEFYKEKGLL